MSDERKNEVQKEADELLDDDLEQVSGGAGMRKVRKEKTVDISEDVLRRI